jgi:hypothetical protein
LGENNKFNKLLGRLKKSRQKTQLTIIKTQKGDDTIGTAVNVHRMTRISQEALDSKFGKLDEVEPSLKRLQLRAADVAQ